MHLGQVANQVLTVLLAAVPMVIALPHARAREATPGHAAPLGPPPEADPSPQPPGTAGPRVWPRAPGGLKPRIECVAHELDPAPGLPGLWYYLLSSGGGMDAAGNCFFCAYLDGPGVTGANDLALFYGSPGDVSLVVWESQQAADMPAGVVIASLFYSAESLSQDGQIAFSAVVSGPGITAGVNDGVLYVGTPTEFHKLRQSGDPAPTARGPRCTIRRVWVTQLPTCLPGSH
jgi:hypothetical protein